MSAYGSDPQDRLVLDLDAAADVVAAIAGGTSSTLRAAEIACYFSRAVSRVGVAYYPQPSSVAGATLYVTTTSYLGDEPIGSTGSTATIGPNIDGNHVMYVDVIPADRVWLNIGINVPANVIPDVASWRFTIIGSNNKKLGLHP